MKLLSLVIATFPLIALSASKTIGPAWTVNHTPQLKEGPQDEVVHFALSQWIVGQLKPCGCSMASYGGLEARKRELDKMSKKYKNLIVIDAGNALFPDAEVLSEHKENFKGSDPLKDAQTLISTYENWGLNAFIPALYERNQHFENTKKVFAKKPKFPILSLDPRFSSVAQKFLDIPLSKGGIRLIPLGQDDLGKGSSAAPLGELMHPSFLNVLVGDAHFQQLKDLQNKSKLNGQYLYLGSGLEINTSMPTQGGNIWQVSGAFRDQNWMLVKVVMDNKNKKVGIDIVSIPTFIEKPKSSKKN